MSQCESFVSIRPNEHLDGCGELEELQARLKKHALPLSCKRFSNSERMLEEAVSVLSSGSGLRSTSYTALIAELLPKESKELKHKRENDKSDDADVGRELRKRIAANEERNSPSQNARPANYLEHQARPIALYDGRYANFPIQKLRARAFVPRLSFSWLGHGAWIVISSPPGIRLGLATTEQGIASFCRLPHKSRFEYSAALRYFPLATSYKADEKTNRFQYEKPLKGADPICVYLASECTSKRKIGVKFVERYGQEAHEELQKISRAPQLIYYGPIRHDPIAQMGAGKRGMVIMEYVEGKTLIEEKASESVRLSVGTAIYHLHARNMVHGDIRPPDVMIIAGKGESDGEEAERVRIIDFDWAGAVGEVLIS
ncbi:hypothetical protein D9757_000878 [Collybiopsis confluens]|uniref:Protein kinase domain-containing protein n=1 Tax=Collybiopsis confluens TaxID=2823264 RepID=A0A8H5I0C9_9AGAR|nr:hypothetical protein D9757_000878 [Collybiopsis confluens]